MGISVRKDHAKIMTSNDVSFSSDAMSFIDFVLIWTVNRLSLYVTELRPNSSSKLSILAPPLNEKLF